MCRGTVLSADKQFLQRQYDFLRLLVRIEQPNYYEDLVRLGNSYDIEANIQNYKVSHGKMQIKIKTESLKRAKESALSPTQVIG